VTFESSSRIFSKPANESAATPPTCHSSSLVPIRRGIACSQNHRGAKTACAISEEDCDVVGVFVRDDEIEIPILIEIRNGNKLSCGSARRKVSRRIITN